MNREIKFRGKRADNGEWIYGDLLNWYDSDDNNKHNCCIVPIDFSSKNNSIKEIIVIPETVGQYLGMFDLNGKEAYEGDIYLNDDNSCIGVFKIESDLCNTVYTTEYKDRIGGTIYNHLPFKELDTTNFVISGTIHDQKNEVLN